MAKKMWDGRFSKETDKAVNDYNSSISFDHRLYKEDIRGSIAHAAMLGERGIIAREDCDAILEGLQGILSDMECGKLLIDPNAEDIHMFVEDQLTRRIGDAGKRLHTGRSRNDQVALDLKMYLDAPNPHDACQIEGDPSLKVLVDGGVAGDAATVASVVNAAPRILKAAPGLLLMTDIGVPSFA